MIFNQIGYWTEECREEPPYILLEREREYDYESVSRYLRSGFKIFAWQGYARCIFTCGIRDEDMGSWDVTDGVWMWPEGFSHYVEFHKIDLPKKFLEHIERSNYKLEIDEVTQEKLEKIRETFHTSPDRLAEFMKSENDTWKIWINEKLKAQKISGVEKYKNNIEKYIYTEPRKIPIGLPPLPPTDIDNFIVKPNINRDNTDSKSGFDDDT